MTIAGRSIGKLRRSISGASGFVIRGFTDDAGSEVRRRAGVLDGRSGSSAYLRTGVGSKRSRAMSESSTPLNYSGTPQKAGGSCCRIMATSAGCAERMGITLVRVMVGVVFIFHGYQ